MSTRYGTDFIVGDDDEGDCIVITEQTDRGSLALEYNDVAERMNKMQDVIDVAGDIISDSRKVTDAAIVVSGPVIAELMRRLAALKPKTTEQLLAERLKAADNLRSKAERQRILNDEESFSRMSLALTEFDAAKSAHEASL